MKNLALSLALLLLSSGLPLLGQFENVGSLDFPTSSLTKEAQHYFLRGAAMLHSFGWKQAIEQFRKAQEIEPDFAMAYWGESLCYNHPLLGERDRDSPRAVLARLGATPEERALKAPTDREKGFLDAVEALFGEGEPGARRIAYMETMKGLYERYPDDPEVAAFYSLSLLMATGPLGDREFRHPVRAGTIALQLFEKNPDHPGAAHYTIHAFDDPVHAPLALNAAFRFAQIAPAVAHARHMPSHIFIQHGMWNHVASSNISAYHAAIDLWESGDSVGDAVHALDWGQYGHLQRGDYVLARDWIGLLEDLGKRSDGAARAVSTVPLMQTRYMVETGDWGRYTLADQTSAVAWFGRGMNALAANDPKAAQKAASEIEKKIAGIAEDTSTFARSRKPTQIMHKELLALVALEEGRAEEALALLEEGVAIANEMGAPRGSASPLKPIHELYGEALIDLGRADDAIEHFEATLEGMPNRPLSLLGLARSQAQAGNESEARRAYEKLLEVWSDSDKLTGYIEAQQFVATAATGG